MKIYIDTNVYLDYLLARKNKQGIDLSKPAFEVLKRTVSCEFEIIVSDLLFKELCGNIKLEDVRMMAKFLKKKIIKICEEEQDQTEADKFEHKNDARHAILAIKGKAELIITRNISHFKDFLIQAKLPEEI